MSVIYCEKHHIQWDSDWDDECPGCENEPTKPTPTPWQLGNAGTNFRQIIGGGIVIADVNTTSYETREANAAFIVRACNVHHVLLHNLQLILEVSDRNNYEQYRAAVREIAKEAIAEVEANDA